MRFSATASRETPPSRRRGSVGRQLRPYRTVLRGRCRRRRRSRRRSGSSTTTSTRPRRARASSTAARASTARTRASRGRRRRRSRRRPRRRPWGAPRRRRRRASGWPPRRARRPPRPRPRGAAPRERPLDNLERTPSWRRAASGTRGALRGRPAPRRGTTATTGRRRRRPPQSSCEIGRLSEDVLPPKPSQPGGVRPLVLSCMLCALLLLEEV
mmetsp:Transcript_14502/g.57840  ORF Transcript_14502/g.57840 Transcript_14502/m.57840 type:complete len:213 (+) Transcript_14502:1055-1693(+)